MSSNSSPSHSESSANIGNSRSSDIRALIATMEEGISPKVLISHLVPSFHVPSGADDMMLWRLLVSMIDPPRRKKLSQYNTLEDVINLISKSKKIMVLSGAGISTSAGLPDFRSRNGIYVQIHAEHPDLHDPKSMFDIEYFRKNPLPFYQFAKALYPGQYKPTIGHKFIKCIEDHNKLLRNYSQNIDTLEKQAGIKRVVECHGSFDKATCTNCKYNVNGDVIRADILEQKIPLCPRCHMSNDGPQDRLGVMKPNIVFFGEQLGDDFHNSLELDKEQMDLLIVIGSSLKVRPVALIPKSVPAHVPQVLINKEPLDHMSFDIELLGDCDEIIQELCLRMGDGWTNICEPNTARLTEIVELSTFKVNARPDYPINQTSDVCNDLVNNQSIPDSNEKTVGGIKDDQDNISIFSATGDGDDELSSFKSNQANVASLSTGENMIEELDEVQEQNCISENGDLDECAITRDQGSDDDWEDIEVLQSSPDSLNLKAREKAKLMIPQSSYLFLKPNKYIFQGAELTNAQFESYTKELQLSSRRNEQPQFEEDNIE